MNYKNLRLYAIAISFAIGMATWATPLTPQQAVARLSVNERAKTSLASSIVADPAFTQYADNAPALYVFTAHENNGYMVVSADDCAPALLGYSTTDNFNATAIPEPMKEWLEEYSLQIAAMRNNPSSTMVKGSIRSLVEKHEIAPQLTTLWNQGSPYNQDCPKVGTASTYSGCVATAMAQVMKYHNWPPKGTGSHSYEWNEQTLSMDFSQRTFDWGNMTNTYSSSSTVAQKNAVAYLMHACGISVDMGYGTSASGAVTSKVPGALIQYFDYAKESTFIQHAYVKDYLWEDYLYNSLSTTGPVLFSGRNSEGGHAFVCDGYSQGYYHFNWGWGGSSNGWFLLTALNPSSQGIGGTTKGYNASQGIMINARPMYEGSKPYFIMAFNKAIEMEYTKSTNAVKLSGFFFNMTPDTINTGVGIQLTWPSGKKEFMGNAGGTLKVGYGYTWYNVTLPSLSENGIYTIQPAYFNRNEENPEWLLMGGGPGISDYCKLSVDNGTATVLSNAPENFEATDLTFNSSIYRTVNFSVSAKYTNPNNYENTQEVYGTLWKKSDTGYTLYSYGDPMRITVPAKDSINYEYISSFTNNTPTVGTFYFAMSVLDGEEMHAISDLHEVEILNNTASVVLAASNYQVINSANVDASKPIKISVDIRDTQGVYANNFLLQLGTGNDRPTYTSPAYFFTPGETKNIVFDAVFPGKEFKEGESCSVYMYYYRGTSKIQLGTPTTFTVTRTTAVDAIEQSATAIIQSSNEIIITSSSEITEVGVYNIGATAMPVAITRDGEQCHVDIAALNSGIYMLRYTDADGIHTHKLIKK